MVGAEIFDNIDANLLAKFKKYHLENPHVFKAFRKAAIEMQKTGRKKYSAWTIVNKIRWDFDLSSKNNEFKINNDFIAIYARLLIYKHSEFAGFFELRTMKPEDRRDSGEEIYRRKEMNL